MLFSLTQSPTTSREQSEIMPGAALLMLLGLCTLCAAQMPPPTMSDTFEGSGEVEFHGAEATSFGQFTLSRDQTKMMGFEKEQYEDKQGPAEITETVLRYDQDPEKAYYVRGDVAHPHCIEEERKRATFSKFWGWLPSATYEGTVPIREIMYDTWAANVGGVRFEFGKPQSNSSILYFYRRKTTESSVFYSFMRYSLTPNPELFQVPQECKEAKKTL